MSMAYQVRENQELGTQTGLYYGRLILTEYVVKPVYNGHSQEGQK